MKTRFLLWLPLTLATVGGATALYLAWSAGETGSAGSAAPGPSEPAPGVEPPPRPGAAVFALLHLGSRVGRIEEVATRDGSGQSGFERHVRLQVRRGERRAAVTRTLRGMTRERGSLAQASLEAPGLRVVASVSDDGARVALTVDAHGQSSTHELSTPAGEAAGQPAPVHLEATAFPWMARTGLRPGRSERVSWLDLEHGRMDPVTLRVGEPRAWHGLRGTELIVVLPHGIAWTALVDDAGQVLRAQSLIPGVETRRWRPVDDSRPLHAVDLGGWGQVLTSGALPDGGRLRALRLGVRGVPASLLPAELELRAQPLPEDSPPATDSPEAAATLGAAPFLERDAPAMQERARLLAPPGTTPLQAARAISRFVGEHVLLRDAVGPPSALATLLSGRGNCNELAALSVALLRAAGHGARLVFGVAHQGGAFRYHAWAEVLTRTGWAAFDPTLRQFPVDVTHLRLSAGGLDAQAAVLAATGRLTLQVLATEEEP